MMKRRHVIFLAVSLCLLAAMVEFCGQEGKPDTRPLVPEGVPNEWGVTLTAKNVRRGGLTIVCTQSGGTFSGELSTGAPYWLEEKTEQGWRLMEPDREDLAWTAEGWMIPVDGTVEWEVRWASLYGSLKKGTYRIGKSVMDWREAGEYDLQSVYAEFTID